MQKGTSSLNFHENLSESECKNSSIYSYTYNINENVINAPKQKPVELFRIDALWWWRIRWKISDENAPNKFPFEENRKWSSNLLTIFYELYSHYIISYRVVFEQKKNMQLCASTAGNCWNPSDIGTSSQFPLCEWKFSDMFEFVSLVVLLKIQGWNVRFGFGPLRFAKSKTINKNAFFLLT